MTPFPQDRPGNKPRARSLESCKYISVGAACILLPLANHAIDPAHRALHGRRSLATRSCRSPARIIEQDASCVIRGLSSAQSGSYSHGIASKHSARHSMTRAQPFKWLRALRSILMLSRLIKTNWSKFRRSQRCVPNLQS